MWTGCRPMTSLRRAAGGQAALGRIGSRSPFADLISAEAEAANRGASSRILRAMITPVPDSPLVTFIRAQIPIAARLVEGVRIDHAALCALLDAHDAWALTHLPRPGTAQPLEADVTAVATLFKRSRSWVYLQLRDGRFPGAYVDRRGIHRFPQACLDAFTAAERTSAPHGQKSVRAVQR